MIFLLLLGLLIPAITHTEEQPSDIKHLFGLKHTPAISALKIAEPFEEETFIKAQQTYKDLKFENNHFFCDDIKKALREPLETSKGINNYISFKKIFYAKAITIEYGFLYNKATKHNLDVSQLPTPKQLKYVLNPWNVYSNSSIRYLTLMKLPKNLFPKQAQNRIEQKVDALSTDTILHNLQHINAHTIEEMFICSSPTIDHPIKKQSIINRWKRSMETYKEDFKEDLEPFFAKNTEKEHVNDFITEVYLIDEN